jgi:hypothetical protein
VAYRQRAASAAGQSEPQPAARHGSDACRVCGLALSTGMLMAPLDPAVLRRVLDHSTDAACSTKVRSSTNRTRMRASRSASSIYDQLPDEARVLARSSAIGGFSSPTDCAATLCRQPHLSPPHPRTRHIFYLFPPLK